MASSLSSFFGYSDSDELLLDSVRTILESMTNKKEQPSGSPLLETTPLDAWSFLERMKKMEEQPSTSSSGEAPREFQNVWSLLKNARNTKEQSSTLPSSAIAAAGILVLLELAKASATRESERAKASPSTPVPSAKAETSVSSPAPVDNSTPLKEDISPVVSGNAVIGKEMPPSPSSVVSGDTVVEKEASPRSLAVVEETPRAKEKQDNDDGEADSTVSHDVSTRPSDITRARWCGLRVAEWHQKRLALLKDWLRATVVNYLIHQIDNAVARGETLVEFDMCDDVDDPDRNWVSVSEFGQNLQEYVKDKLCHEIKDASVYAEYGPDSAMFAAPSRSDRKCYTDLVEHLKSLLEAPEYGFAVRKAVSSNAVFISWFFSDL